jgi:hypothetical protein
MPRRSRQQIQRMRQQPQHCQQGALRARRTSRQVQNQRTAANPTNSTPQRRKRSMPHTLLPYQLRHPRHHSLAHIQRRFRSHIASRQSCPSGRHHQRSSTGCFTQGRRNFPTLIGNHLDCGNGSAGRRQHALHRRPRSIHLCARKTPVADGQNNRPASDKVAYHLQSHPRSLPNRGEGCESTAEGEKIEPASIKLGLAIG